MIAKSFQWAGIFLAVFVCAVAAGTSRLPDIPTPTLTATQVIAIGEKRFGERAKDYTLVAIEWQKSSAYQPRVSTGATYTPANDQPDEYSWFLTYVTRDEREAEAMMRMGISQHFNSALTQRIKDGGEDGLFIGVQ